VLAAGGKWIQLRVKEKTEEEVLPLAIAASKLCERYHAKLIVNDYPRVALQAGAAGVHLGLDDMPVPEARALLGKAYCIGGTANTFADILRRADEGADYIGLGPFRFTATKKNLSPVLGLEGYAALMEEVRLAGIRIPIIAIGGIVLADIPSILLTGIYGIAVSGTLTYHTDHQQQIKAFYNQLNRNEIKEFDHVKNSR
jgi:thiamine-phosphate pyrophosphorylase